MQQEFLNHINKNLPFIRDKKLLIAISGGIDSVVLTHLLSALNFNISLAHCNFNLRGIESNKDENFIISLGEKLNVKTFTTKFNTEEFAKKNKQSTQIAARNLRYNWFNELTNKYEFDFVLTAHHADDNLETFLINLTRGTGLEGLTGIPEVNGNIVRPLLKFSREKIIAFANQKNIDWREDKSNTSTKYTRNKIRHKIVPVLKEINPSLLETFANTTNHLQESLQIIADRIDDVSSEVIKKEQNFTKLDVQNVKKLSNPKAYLYEFLKDYNFTEWNDVYNLLFAQSGKQLFSKTHTLLKDREYLILSKNSFLEVEKEYLIKENQIKITNPINLKLEEVKIINATSKQNIFVDKEKLEFPLKLRKWKNGDFFFPKGMQGKKKLSKYFKDEKFSLLDKQNTWLLCNNNNDILWVIGYRQDNRFIISENTKKFIKISI